MSWWKIAGMTEEERIKQLQYFVDDINEKLAAFVKAVLLDSQGNVYSFLRAQVAKADGDDRNYLWVVCANRLSLTTQVERGFNVDLSHLNNYGFKSIVDRVIEDRQRWLDAKYTLQLMGLKITEDKDENTTNT